MLLRSSVANRFAWMSGVYLVCVASYVGYQIMSGNPFDSAEEMIRQATIQKQRDGLMSFTLKYAH